MAKKKNFVTKALKTLGLVATDKITSFNGVAESISFDLYGCVQVALKPTSVKEDGTVKDGMWFDINRLDVSKNRLMTGEDFDDVEDTLDTLGLVTKDKITGFEGVAESIAFDLYGNVLVGLKPTTVKEDGSIKDGMWFDIARLDVSEERRMKAKDFFAMPIDEPEDYNHGPADKATMRRA